MPLSKLIACHAGNSQVAFHFITRKKEAALARAASADIKTKSLIQTVTLLKHIDTAARIYEFLLSRKERVAF
jgi:hypothetical protein